MQFFRDLLGMIILGAVVYLGMHLVVGAYTLTDDAMAPGLNAGQKIFYNKLSYSFNRPDRGDVIYFSSTGATAGLKRIVGLPGDVIEIKHQALYINGIQIREPYVKQLPDYDAPEIQVPLGNYLVLSDNRKNTDDLSAGWTVTASEIQGRAWAISWPPDRWGSVANYPLSSQLATVELP